MPPGSPEEVWALSLYHTLADRFEGMGLLVVLALLALAARVDLGRSNMHSPLADAGPAVRSEEAPTNR